MNTTYRDAAAWAAGYADYLRDAVGAADATRARHLPTVRRTGAGSSATTPCPTPCSSASASSRGRARGGRGTRQIRTHWRRLSNSTVTVAPAARRTAARACSTGRARRADVDIEPIFGHVDADEHRCGGWFHDPCLCMRARAAAQATVRVLGQRGGRRTELSHGLEHPATARATTRHQPRPIRRGWQLRDTSHGRLVQRREAPVAALENARGPAVVRGGGVRPRRALGIARAYLASPYLSPADRIVWALAPRAASSDPRPARAGDPLKECGRHPARAVLPPEQRNRNLHEKNVLLRKVNDKQEVVRPSNLPASPARDFQRERLAFLALASIRGVGYWTLWQIAKSGIGFSSIIEADDGDVANSLLRKFGARLANKPADNWPAVKVQIQARAEETLLELHRLNIKIVLSEEDDFPLSLKEVSDPPYWLFVQGDIRVLHQASVHCRYPRA